MSERGSFVNERKKAIMKANNLFEIIKTFLRENNFDGLYNEDYECNCYIDDLFPCDEPNVNFKIFEKDYG